MTTQQKLAQHKGKQVTKRLAAEAWYEAGVAKHRTQKGFTKQSAKLNQHETK